MNNNLPSANMMTPTSLAIVRADSKRFPRLCRMNPLDVNAGVRNIIQKAYLYKGQTADPTQLEFLVGNLINEILAERTYGLPELTLVEIDYVIKKRILEDPEFFITISHIYRALVTYCKGEGHTASLEAVRANTNKIPEELETLARIHAGRMLKQIK